MSIIWTNQLPRTALHHRSGNGRKRGKRSNMRIRNRYRRNRNSYISRNSRVPFSFPPNTGQVRPVSPPTAHQLGYAAMPSCSLI